MIATGTSHDPMPAGKLGMWFFLASEAMFFVGLLGSFVVLGSAGGQHELFVKSAAMLSRWLGFGGAIFLVIASAALRENRLLLRWIAVTAAICFLCTQLLQCGRLLNHHTFVYLDGTGLNVSDGIGLTSRQIPLQEGFDIHKTTTSDFDAAIPQFKYFVGIKPLIIEELNYGPSRNNFFGCYFLFTAVHCLHLIAGMIALLWFMIRGTFPGLAAVPKGRRLTVEERPFGTAATRGNPLPASLQIYWHFVNTMGVISLAVLYFV